jgi:DNA-binding Xre family transcriptional regulator
MAWWLIAAAAMSAGSSLMGFSMGRREDKTHLQKLHQDKLLTRFNTVSNTNTILDILKSAQSDNITVAGTANYHAFDSASFKAIQKRMTTLAEKDITNLELTNQIAISGINTSISNLNFNMRMKEFKLFMDIGSTIASTNYYMKDQATEVATRQAEIVKQNRIEAEVARQGRIMSNYYKQGYNKVRFHKRFEKIEKYGSLTARGRY